MAAPQNEEKEEWAAVVDGFPLYKRLRRFISEMEDEDMESIASSISQDLPPIHLIRRRRRSSCSDSNPAEVRMSTQLVRHLLEGAAFLYSVQKAKRTPAAAAAVAVSPSQLHEQIDAGATGRPSPWPLMTKIAAALEIMPPSDPSPADVREEGAVNVILDLQQQKLEAVRQLLHRVADVVSYSEFEQAMERPERSGVQSMKVLRLALFFKVRLHRFIERLQDARLERTASSISLPPIQLIRRRRNSSSSPPPAGAGSEELTLSTEQVRILLHGAAIVYSYEKANRIISTPAAAAVSRLQLHERMDDGMFGYLLKRKIAAEVMPAPCTDEVGAVGELLHHVVDVVDYTEFDEAIGGRGEEQQRNLSEDRSVVSEELLRSWMHDVAEVATTLTIANEMLPPLRQLPPRSVRLSEAQLRRCFHGISETIKLHKVIESLVIDFDVDKALTEAMIRELQFAVAVINEYLHDLHQTSLEREQQQSRSLSDRLFFSAKSTDPDSWFNWFQQNREAFLQRSKLERPQALRFIDLEATSRERVVCLVDYEQVDTDAGFTAVSHTFGMEVYEIFDCRCAAKWADSNHRVQPRWRVGPCPHHETVSCKMKRTRDRLVGDILRLCDILRREAGARYAWHDGVCIAQHDDAEVNATIERIGWVYGYATDTVIFLHYVGKPMAILKHCNAMMIQGSWDLAELKPRWQTRAWTLQEAVLSKTRRYCVRVASSPIVVDVAHCRSLQVLERTVEQWYDDDTSCIRVVDETTFIGMVSGAYRTLEDLRRRFSTKFLAEYLGADDESDRVLLYPKACTGIKAREWRCGLQEMENCFLTYWNFPTAAHVLREVSGRDSKHVGDRINAILALSGVTGWVAPKDVGMERSTVDFFRRQGQRGLQTALYAINYVSMDDAPGKRWIPCVSEPLYIGLHSEAKQDRHLLYSVLDSDKLKVMGEMVCLKVNFRITDVASVDMVDDGDDITTAPAAAALNASITQVGRLIASSPTADPALLSDALENHRTAFLQYVRASMAGDVGTSTMATSSASSSLWRDYVDLYNRQYSLAFDSSYLSMLSHSLNVHSQHVYGTSSLTLHPKSVVENIGCEQETVISMELRAMLKGTKKTKWSHCYSALWPSDPRCKFGMAWSPYFDDRRGKGSFSAYLMWPLAVVVEEAQLRLPWPMLMVEGDLERGPVEKIGVFEPSILFRACVRHLLKVDTCTTLRFNQLLIN